MFAPQFFAENLFVPWFFAWKGWIETGIDTITPVSPWGVSSTGTGAWTKAESVSASFNKEVGVAASWAKSSSVSSPWTE